ncbi:hypothetical protein Q8W71_29225 [Methylobacterium sp. NEAU 140]|uniref:hypothetical protein n=1 Tax=Methylobacterium sp. NEAU 140 TaxID=3064945 RepID=UPI002735555C|nr:hypothetical protein [Methylobacterium sp. NEAU 140]MDP4026693.1 hypothetical protein [Methylobacterium sp. NEAU 140]
MSMTAREDCVNELRMLIDEADEARFGTAQNLLLRYAYSQDGPEERAAALDRLLDDLGGGRADMGSPAQQAFRAALLAMIERTSLVVGPGH